MKKTKTIPTETTTKCIIPTCDKESRWKGLCGSCYHHALTFINKGETSWEELDSLGLAQAPVPFIAAYKAAKRL